MASRETEVVTSCGGQPKGQEQTEAARAAVEAQTGKLADITPQSAVIGGDTRTTDALSWAGGDHVLNEGSINEGDAIASGVHPTAGGFQSPPANPATNLHHGGHMNMAAILGETK